jgi:hypothetical protein
MRGWAALLAVLAAGLLFAFQDPSGPGEDSPVWFMFPVITAMPCASLYSFFAFKRAPDRRMALAGLVGGIILGIMSVLFVGTCAVAFALTFASHTRS